MDAEPVQEMTAFLNSEHVIVRRKGIREVAAILSHARLVVSNDTGIMHVAAAAGVPVLSFFGPTDPQQWAPIGTHHRYLQSADGNIARITVDEAGRTALDMLRIGRLRAIVD